MRVIVAVWAVFTAYMAAVGAYVTVDQERVCRNLFKSHTTGPLPMNFACPGGFGCTNCLTTSPYHETFGDYCDYTLCGNDKIDGPYPETCDSGTYCVACQCRDETDTIPTVPTSLMCCPRTIPVSNFSPPPMTPFSGGRAQLVTNMRDGASSVMFPVPLPHWVGPTIFETGSLHPTLCVSGSRCLEASSTVTFIFHVWIGTDQTLVCTLNVALSSIGAAAGDLTLSTATGVWLTTVDIEANARGQWSTIQVSVPMRYLHWGRPNPALAASIVARAHRTPLASDIIPGFNYFTISGIQKVCFAVAGVQYTGIRQLLPPLLLVHGILSSESAWQKWSEWLTPAAGPNGIPVVWLFYALKWNYFHSVDAIPVLQHTIRALQTEWLIAHVAIVAHSKGGLLTRAYLGQAGLWGSVAGGSMVASRSDFAARFTIGAWQVQLLSTPNCGTPFADKWLPVAQGGGCVGTGSLDSCITFDSFSSAVIDDMKTSYMSAHQTDRFGPNCNVEIGVRCGSDDFLVPPTLTYGVIDGQSSCYCEAVRPYMKEWESFTEFDPAWNKSPGRWQHSLIHESEDVFTQTTSAIWGKYLPTTPSAVPADTYAYPYSPQCPATRTIESRRPLQVEDESSGSSLLTARQFAVPSTVPVSVSVGIGACDQFRITIGAYPDFQFAVHMSVTGVGSILVFNTSAVQRSVDGTVTMPSVLIVSSQSLCSIDESNDASMCMRYDATITSIPVLAALPATVNLTITPYAVAPGVNTNISLAVDASELKPDLEIALSPSVLVRAGQMITVNATLNYGDTPPARAIAVSDVTVSSILIDATNNVSIHTHTRVGTTFSFVASIIVPSTACGQRMRIAIIGGSTPTANPLTPWSQTRFVSIPVACTSTAFETSAMTGTGAAGARMSFVVANDTNGDGASDGVIVIVPILVDAIDFQLNATFLVTARFVIGSLNTVSGQTLMDVNAVAARTGSVLAGDGTGRRRINVTFTIDTTAFECYTAACCSVPVDVAIDQLEMTTFDVQTGRATLQDSMVLSFGASGRVSSSPQLFDRCAFRQSVLIVNAFHERAVPSTNPNGSPPFVGLQFDADLFVAKQLFYSDNSFTERVNLTVCADVSTGEGRAVIATACAELTELPTEYQSGVTFTVGGDALRDSAFDGVFWVLIRLTEAVASRSDIPRTDESLNRFNTSSYRFVQFGTLPVATYTLRAGEIRELHSVPDSGLLFLSGELPGLAYGIWSVTNQSFAVDPIDTPVSLPGPERVAITGQATSTSFWLAGTFAVVQSNGTTVSSALLSCEYFVSNGTGCYDYACSAARTSDTFDVLPAPTNGVIRRIRVAGTGDVACMTGDFLLPSITPYFAVPVPDTENDTLTAAGVSVQLQAVPMYCMFLRNETAHRDGLAIAAVATSTSQSTPSVPVASPFVFVPASASMTCAVDAMAFEWSRLYFTQSCGSSVIACDVHNDSALNCGDATSRIVFSFDSPGSITAIHSAAGVDIDPLCLNPSAIDTFLATYYFAEIVPRAALLFTGDFTNAGFGLSHAAYFDCITFQWRSPVTIPNGPIDASTPPANGVTYLAGGFTSLDALNPDTTRCGGVARLTLADMRWLCLTNVTIVRGRVVDVAYTPESNQLWLTGVDQFLMYRNDTGQYFSKFGFVPVPHVSETTPLPIADRPRCRTAPVDTSKTGTDPIVLSSSTADGAARVSSSAGFVHSSTARSSSAAQISSSARSVSSSATPISSSALPISSSASHLSSSAQQPPSSSSALPPLSSSAQGSTSALPISSSTAGAASSSVLAFSSSAAAGLSSALPLSSSAPAVAASSSSAVAAVPLSSSGLGPSSSGATINEVQSSSAIPASAPSSSSSSSSSSADALVTAASSGAAGTGGVTASASTGDGVGPPPPPTTSFSIAVSRVNGWIVAGTTIVATAFCLLVSA